MPICITIQGVQINTICIPNIDLFKAPVKFLNFLRIHILIKLILFFIVNLRLSIREKVLIIDHDLKLPDVLSLLAVLIRLSQFLLFTNEKLSSFHIQPGVVQHVFTTGPLLRVNL